MKTFFSRRDVVVTAVVTCLASTWLGCATADPLVDDLDTIRLAHGVPALGVYGAVAGQEPTSVVVGFRKLGDQTPATPADEFHFGSAGKAMTATLAALFVEKGQLRWDSTLGELLPDLTRLNPRYRGVTLEMLLAHHGGVTGDLTHFGDGTLWKSLWRPGLAATDGRRMLLEGVLALEPAYEPGSKFVYSNAGMVIVGTILERIAGKPYEELLRERLWAPLGMQGCGFGAAGDATAVHPDQPWAHRHTDAGPVPVPPGPDADNPAPMSPAGRMRCTMADWARFLRLHSDGFNGLPTPILSPASFAKLHAPYPGGEDTYGAWVRMEGREWAHGPVFGYEGDNTLNHALVLFAPKIGTIFIAVTNYGDDEGGLACHAAALALKSRVLQHP